jgi:hypothetical protein
MRFGGIVQRISEQTTIGRDEVVQSGASQYQDTTSHRGNDYQAAHVVRAGEIKPEIKQFRNLFKELVNFLGHTQIVLKYANVPHGVGGDIDRFQSKNLNKLRSINFRDSLTAEGESTIQGLIEDFIAILDKRINEERLRQEEKWELIKAKSKLTKMTINSLFDKGNEGYKGKGMDRYQ